MVIKMTFDEVKEIDIVLTAALHKILEYKAKIKHKIEGESNASFYNYEYDKSYKFIIYHQYNKIYCKIKHEKHR